MILRMKRITLVAHKADEADILKALQATDAVEVIENTDLRDDGAAELTRAQERVHTLSAALTAMKPFAPKKGFLSAKPEQSLETLREALPEALVAAQRLDEEAHELARVNSEIEQNEQLMESLRPWRNFPADMQRFNSARSIQYFPGILAEADLPRLDEIADAAEYQCFSEGTLRPTVVACRRDEAKAVASFLKTLDWTDMSFPKMEGTPREASERLQAQNETLIRERDARREKLEAQTKENELLLLGGHDVAMIDCARAEAAADMAHSSATFVLEGWTPEDRLPDVEAAVNSVTDAYSFESRDAEDDEIPPSMVHNNDFVTPFEQVTNLYSRPDPHGIDATPYMTPFYVLLFGLMLSDSGYGLVLSLLCLAYIKLKKPTGMSGGFARVLFWGGISTIVWGVLVGTCFGLSFDTIFGTTGVFPLLIDPMSDPITMLILCFGLGLVHILFGMCLKMKMSFQRGDWQTAVFDNLSWMFIIFGLLGLILPATKTVGMILALLGALMILLFKGRGKRNPLKRTVSGLAELYQVTSYLSDILSYARLFALGIATGVIASVFNELCSMLMTSNILVLKILGIIVACALLVFMHLFNLGINTLGAFVHCARLQYVEFYGKFYEPGGRAFRPLGYRTKHVRITDKAS